MHVILLIIIVYIYPEWKGAKNACGNSTYSSTDYTFPILFTLMPLTQFNFFKWLGSSLTVNGHIEKKWLFHKGITPPFPERTMFDKMLNTISLKNVYFYVVKPVENWRRWDNFRIWMSKD
jgi:hypothetical protein